MAKRPRYANNLLTLNTNNLGQKATLREQPTNLKPTNLKPANLKLTNLKPTNLKLTNLGLLATLREQPTNLGLLATLREQPTNLKPTNLQQE
ncbi:hypothetical protein [Moorena bouillonii]|uniref:hypothetical protein n=1 Tax=Moorena bouillonii TaxID=207920 RepID=UPI001180098D|nr:hypothetical protein [Moorena bouillonii]